jgi:hypothetical protein
MVKADEGVQILLDVGGDETTYHGFFVTQANTLRDESVSIPGAPVDYNPWRRYQGLLPWNHPAVQHAVTVSVPVDTVRSWGPTDREPGNGTYTMEIAIPWHVTGRRWLGHIGLTDHDRHRLRGCKGSPGPQSPPDLSPLECSQFQS